MVIVASLVKLMDVKNENSGEITGYMEVQNAPQGVSIIPETVTLCGTKEEVRSKLHRLVDSIVDLYENPEQIDPGKVSGQGIVIRQSKIEETSTEE